MLNVKYRPKTVKALVGNTNVKESLTDVLERGEDHTFLFTGAPGTGKTTMAYILRNELGINKENFYEYNMANTRGIDTIREIKKNSEYKGFFDQGDKLYLFDEFHRQTIDALNSMLKFIEEPPPHVYIVLCTSEFNTIKETIRKAVKRRCNHYELSRLRRPELILLLKRVTKKEGKDYNKIMNRLSHIADISDSPGQALNYLGKVLHLESDEEAIELLNDEIADTNTVIDLCNILVEHKFGKKAMWERCQKVLNNLPDDPEKTRAAVLTIMNKKLLSKRYSIRAAEVADMFTKPMYHRAALTTACFWLCFGPEEDIVL